MRSAPEEAEHQAMNPSWLWRSDVGMWLLQHGPLYWWVPVGQEQNALLNLRTLDDTMYQPESEMVQ
jgi:hypothetical protein